MSGEANNPEQGKLSDVCPALTQSNRVMRSNETQGQVTLLQNEMLQDPKRRTVGTGGVVPSTQDPLGFS